jgi:uncharacterized protein VirK/YbjX
MGEIQSRSLQLPVNALLKVGVQDCRATTKDDLIPARQRSRWLSLLRWPLILALQRISWSPVLIASELWQVLTNIPTQREIFELLKLPPFDEAVQQNPGLAFKYVIPNYLVRGFTVAERASCFLHHYRRIHAVLPERLLSQILKGSVTLHEITKDGNRFAIKIGRSAPPCDKEAELSLSLDVDGTKVFALSFVLAPGWVIRSAVTEVLLITCFKGSRGCSPQIKLLLKAFREYPPRKQLLYALQGIADAFGIDTIAAVCSTKQRAYTQEYSATLKRSYDDFFAEVGMVKTAAGFYSGFIPFEGKPLALFEGRNRPRARKRRAIRRQIQSACSAFILGAADRAADSFSGAANATLAKGAFESRSRPISNPTRTTI